MMHSNAVLVQRIELSPESVLLRVVPDGWELPDFEPGQFAVLGLPRQAKRCVVCDPEDDPSPPDTLIWRAYSIASSSVASEYMEFYVTLVRSGELTPRLFALKNGDRLWLSPKATGLFTLDRVPPDKHVVLISTGTGLAPYMSMLRTHLTCGAPKRFAVLHGARHSWDLGYNSELSTLHNLCANLTYVPTVSRPEEEPAQWSVRSGYVQDLWNARLLDSPWGERVSPANSHVFLCGHPSMIEDMSEVLTGEGYRVHSKKQPDGELHVEKYW